MPKAVLFDLGNTLVRYYSRAEVPMTLKTCVHEAALHLRTKGALTVDRPQIEAGVAAEMHEAPDWKVRPLEARLQAIFKLAPEDAAGPVMGELVAKFLGPVFKMGVRDEAAIPVLTELKRRGIPTAIVSNLPWGSPAPFWRDEVDRRGLLGLVGAFVTCRDAGWRKPAKPIFEQAVAKVGVPAGECLFVGDEPVWDYDGAKAAGLVPLLLVGKSGPPGGQRMIRSLTEVLGQL